MIAIYVLSVIYRLCISDCTVNIALHMGNLEAHPQFVFILDDGLHS